MTAPTYTSPTPNDLGLYMNDDEVYVDRAAYLIVQAEQLCLTVVNPLPVSAVVVVVRVAARAYVSITSARQVHAALQAVGQAPAAGGLWLTPADRADLRRASGTGGAFSIDPLPVGYTPPSDLPYWDATVTVDDGA